MACGGCGRWSGECLCVWQDTVWDFAYAWALKELVLNTDEQTSLVLRGLVRQRRPAPPDALNAQQPSRVGAPSVLALRRCPPDAHAADAHRVLVSCARAPPAFCRRTSEAPAPFCAKWATCQTTKGGGGCSRTSGAPARSTWRSGARPPTTSVYLNPRAAVVLWVCVAARPPQARRRHAGPCRTGSHARHAARAGDHQRPMALTCRHEGVAGVGAAADLFWELVTALPLADKEKLLHFWCSGLPAGGIAGVSILCLRACTHMNATLPAVVERPCARLAPRRARCQLPRPAGLRTRGRSD